MHKKKWWIKRLIIRALIAVTELPMDNLKKVKTELMKVNILWVCCISRNIIYKFDIIAVNC